MTTPDDTSLKGMRDSIEADVRQTQDRNRVLMEQSRELLDRQAERKREFDAKDD